jgi:hypothetical protein
MHDVLYRFVKLSLSSNYCLGDDGDHLICEKTESDVLFQCPWLRSDFELRFKSSRKSRDLKILNFQGPEDIK